MIRAVPYTSEMLWQDPGTRPGYAALIPQLALPISDALYFAGRTSSQTKPRVIYSASETDRPTPRVQRENYSNVASSGHPANSLQILAAQETRLQNLRCSEEQQVSLFKKLELILYSRPLALLHGVNPHFQAGASQEVSGPRVKKRSEKCATVRDILERCQQSAEKSSAPSNPRAPVEGTRGSEIISQNATTPAPDSPPKVEAFPAWQTTPPDILRKIVITDVKVNAVSVTFRECKTPIGFFRNRT